MTPDFSKMNGLIPAVVQDAATGRVLMLGYMNEEAFAQTRQTGRVTFFSRSKGRLWMKGEESGNTLGVKEIKLDCDQDTVLVLATPSGPVCHTGNDTCFSETNSDTLFFLNQLESVIRSRKESPQPGSYTSSLFEEGPQRIAQKVGEEAVEVVIASQGSDRERIVSEAADLVYHLLALLADKEIPLLEVISELSKRSRA